MRVQAPVRGPTRIAPSQTRAVADTAGGRGSAGVLAGTASATTAGRAAGRWGGRSWRQGRPGILGHLNSGSATAGKLELLADTDRVWLLKAIGAGQFAHADLMHARNAVHRVAALNRIEAGGWKPETLPDRQGIGRRQAVKLDHLAHRHIVALRQFVDRIAAPDRNHPRSRWRRLLVINGNGCRSTASGSTTIPPQGGGQQRQPADRGVPGHDERARATGTATGSGNRGTNWTGHSSSRCRPVSVRRMR